MELEVTEVKFQKHHTQLPSLSKENVLLTFLAELVKTRLTIQPYFPSIKNKRLNTLNK